jgi:hypothetical protein
VKGFIEFVVLLFLVTSCTADKPGEISSVVKSGSRGFLVLPNDTVEKYGLPKRYTKICEGTIFALDYNYTGAEKPADGSIGGEGPIYYVNAADNSLLTVCGLGCQTGDMEKCEKGEGCQCDQYCRKEADICELVKMDEIIKKEQTN